jgi:hypothetical protein
MTATEPLVIPAPDAVTIRIPIVSTAPLLVHRFSEKAKKMMLDAAQGRKGPREPKDPQREYEACIYHLKDGERFGFPSVAFKSATVSAARLYSKSVTMTMLRQTIFVGGEEGDDGTLMVHIDGTPTMREDVARVGNGGTDLRYRAQFTEWSATLEVVAITSMLTVDSVLSLVATGGMAVGVGDWRPERSGTFGTYALDQSRDVQIEG